MNGTDSAGPDTLVRPSLCDRWGPTLAAALPWSPPARRTIVVAPHPDDESLSMGGLVAFQRSRGLDVVVVAVTDGEASYDADGNDRLGRTRCAEQWAALEVLGVGESSIERFEIPDSRVENFEGDVSDRLAELLRPGDLVVATWDRDVHPDHEACGRASLNAARSVPVTLVFSLFWTWHHRRGAEIDRSRLLALRLDDSTHATKQRAIRRHESQFRTDNDDAPILDEQLVEPARWSCEYFLATQTLERS